MAKRKYTAKTADKHHLYELSVQCVEAEIDFVKKIWKKRRGRPLRNLREDFCGTAASSCEFVSRNKENRAWGVDLEKSVLDWGREHNLAALGADAERVTLMQENVLSAKNPSCEAVLAMNFSYFCFKERNMLLDYYKAVRKTIAKDGIFFLDAYGGWEAQQEMEEPRKKKGFTYVWDQNKFNPITNEVLNYIHFRFPDGTALKKAFTYDWRLWSLKEITETLVEAGFARADVYWEGWDDEAEEGDGIFKRRKNAENSPGWVAYIVADTVAK